MKHQQNVCPSATCCIAFEVAKSGLNCRQFFYTASCPAPPEKNCCAYDAALLSLANQSGRQAWRPRLGDTRYMQITVSLLVSQNSSGQILHHDSKSMRMLCYSSIHDIADTSRVIELPVGPVSSAYLL